MDQHDKIIVKVDPDLEGIIPGFLLNRQADIQTIQAALEQSDYETIQVAGHKMKGVGGGYGFDAITTISRSIQQAAENQDGEGVRGGVDELASYLERIEVLFE